MRDERFEWDDEKARRNLAYHKVSFGTASLIFDDANAFTELDDEPDEERWRTIGTARGKTLFVVWTARYGNITRIISARRATRQEQDNYYRQARS